MKNRLSVILLMFLLIICSRGCVCTGEGNWAVTVHLPTDLKTFSRIAELGPDMVRVSFVWPVVEPEKGKFEWVVLDNIVDFCQRHEIKIVAVVGYAPSWASGKEGIQHMFQNTKEWQIYLWTLFTRYKGKIYAAEIWNEPNFYKFFSGTMKEYYEQILIPASDVIRWVDKDVKIVAPGVAVLSGRKWSVWLNRAALYKKYFDVISYHVYRSTDWGVIWKIEGIKSLERFRGGIDQSVKQVIRGKFPNKEVWLTETGFENTGSPDAERAQRDNIMGVIWGLPSVDVIFLYHLQDGAQDDDYYGLLRKDGSRTKVYRDLRSSNPLWRLYADEEELEYMRKLESMKNEVQQ